MLSFLSQRLARLAHQFAHKVSLGLAIAGGVLLLALVLLSVLSILGRELAALAFLSERLGPIPGDYELIELGMGFAIFAFLPWAHWVNAHASVDLLRPLFGEKINLALDMVRDGLMLLFAFFLARQLWLGLLDKQSYGETSFILQIPLWWGYAAGLIGALLFVLICVIKFMLLCYRSFSGDLSAYPDKPRAGGGL
ncbi:MAG: TRAP transporter small permease [Cohaesibacter sp.]|nr:TRAP transporter small permease [Cohaesibacter sp.]